MRFYTAFSEPRPIRLSQSTRSFAYESMQGKYGDEAMKTPFVCIPEEQYRDRTPQEKYDLAITAIAKEAPLRICPHETVSGAATLGKSIAHLVLYF